MGVYFIVACDHCREYQDIGKNGRNHDLLFEFMRKHLQHSCTVTHDADEDVYSGESMWYRIIQNFTEVDLDTP